MAKKITKSQWICFVLHKKNAPMTRENIMRAVHALEGKTSAFKPTSNGTYWKPELAKHEHYCGAFEKFQDVLEVYAEYCVKEKIAFSKKQENNIWKQVLAENKCNKSCFKDTSVLICQYVKCVGKNANREKLYEVTPKGIKHCSELLKSS